MLPDDSNPMIRQLQHLTDFTLKNQMKINTKKTVLMTFNRCRNYDFQPEVYLDNQLLDVVETVKLLGIMISSDMKWKKNTDYILKSTYSKLWMLRRIKEVGGSIEDMLDVYCMQIRCLCEIGCAVWNGGLTKSDANRIEKVQKVALKIILGPEYRGYDEARERLGLELLSVRRQDICLKFAKSIEKSDKFASWLKQPVRITKTTPKYVLPFTRTKIYETSSLFYLTQLLNNNP